MEREQEIIEEVVEEAEDDLDDVIPAMNLNLPTPPLPVKEECIISDDALLGIYGEIMQNLRDDREEINNLLTNFVDMVINEGDATPASKEALVNLIKIKSDSSDKMSKVADLMTRIKLKDRDTYKPFLTAHQNNTVNISGGPTRELLKTLEAYSNKKKDKK